MFLFFLLIVCVVGFFFSMIKVGLADLTQSQTDEIVASTLDRITPDVVNHTMLDIPVYEKLLEGNYRKSVTGGHRIRFPFVIANNESFDWFGWGDTFNPQPQRILGWGHATLKQGAGDVVVEWLEGQMNKGPEAFVNILEQKVADLEQSVRQSLNTNLWSDGTGSFGKEASGMAANIPNTPLTGTYMGFDRSTEYWARPWYKDAATATMTRGPHSLSAPTGGSVTAIGAMGSITNKYPTALDNLTTAWNSVMSRENPADIFHLTDLATYEYYLQIPGYCPGRDIGIHEGGKLNMGLTAASFMGAPILWDTTQNGAVAGEWRTVNRKYYKLIVDTSAFFKWTPPREPYNALRTARYLLVRFQGVNTYPRKSFIGTGVTAWA